MALQMVAIGSCSWKNWGLLEGSGMTLGAWGGGGGGGGGVGF